MSERHRFVFGLLIGFTICAAALAGDPPAFFTYQGKIFQANGTDPLEDASVVFTVQILSPDASCLLFEETHPRNMTGTSGIFALMIGQGTNTNATNLTLPQVFDNTTSKTGAAGCTYTPVSGDAPRLRVSYVDNGQPVVLATDQTMSSVPYALNSTALEGLGKNQFIQVSAQTTQAKIDALSTNSAALTSLASGTSTLYSKSSDLPVANGILNLSTGGVQVPNIPASSNDAINENYADANLGGKNLDLTNLSDGQTLLWSVAQNKWLTGTAFTLPSVGTAGTYSKVTTDAQGRVTSGAALSNADIATALGYTALNKAGDTLTGDLNLGGHNLTNTGYITIGSGRYLSLGSYTAATEATLVTSTLTPGGASLAGVTWFNTTTNSVKFWNGTQAVTLSSSTGTLQSLNGQTGATQTFAVGFSGSAPAWSSVTNVHTLNIPMASASGTSAGLLSNSDYASFSAKQSALGYTPLDRAGSNAMSANLNMSPDGGTTDYKIINLKDPAAAQDAATKNYVDTNIGGNKSGVGSLNNSTDIGKVLSWSGTASGWTTVLPNAGTISSLTGDVTASGSGAVAATVASVGGSTAANLHTAEVIANAASSANTNGAVVRRDSSGNFASGTASLGVISLRDSGSNTVSLQAPSSVTSSYSLRLPAGLGSNNQVLSTDASGNLSWTTPAANLPPSGSASGDLSGNYPSPSVAKIQGVAVSTATPQSGQMLVYNGTSQYAPVSISGDASLAANGVLSLKNTGTSGSYYKVTTDAQGRVMSGSALVAGDITTALGYTPLSSAGGVSALLAGTAASLPVAGTAGRLYFETDASKIMRDNGSSWDTIASAAGSGGTVTSVGLSAPSIFTTSGTPVTASGTLSFTLANQSANTVFAGPTTGSAAPGFRNLNIADLHSVVAGSFLTGSGCTSGQALLYVSVSDSMSCTTITLTSSQVTTALGYTPMDSAGSKGMSANLNMSPDNGTTDYKIVNLKDPTNAQDAATKNYVDGSIGGNKDSVGALNNTTDIGKVLSWSGTTSGWTAVVPTAGTVTSVTAGTGLTGGTISSSGTVAVDVGTAANKIVQLDSSARLPAVDGSQLTNIAMPPFSNLLVFSTVGSSTWTVPAGVSKVYVQVWGGGGGGGGGTNLGLGGGGGGAGGYGAGFVSVTAGGTITVVVGAGGTSGGAAGGGGSGGVTSFGSMSAGGGTGGTAIAQGTGPGGTSTAMINITGGSGSAASPLATYSLGGTGGSAGGGGGPGGGGSCGIAYSGAAGSAPGGGGGGGGSGIVSGAAAGGVGGAGRIVLWW